MLNPATREAAPAQAKGASPRPGLLTREPGKSKERLQVACLLLLLAQYIWGPLASLDLRP